MGLVARLCSVGILGQCWNEYVVRIPLPKLPNHIHRQNANGLLYHACNLPGMWSSGETSYQCSASTQGDMAAADRPREAK